MNILVVEPSSARRADLVDAVCELPGIVVRGAAMGLGDALRLISAERMDVVVLGDVPEAERTVLTTVARNQHDCDVVIAGDAPELAAAIENLLARRRSKPDGLFGALAARSKALAFERAGAIGLAHRLRVAQPNPGAESPRGMQTIELQEWLPSMCASFARVIPGIVELVPIISGDTPPVRCVPDILEHEMLKIVLEAAAKLPWGGTVWLTAEHVGADTVRIDVLENGRGTGHDLTLRTSVPALS